MSNTVIDSASLVWLLPELTKTITSARLRLAHAKILTGTDAAKQLLQVKRLIHESTGALEVVGATAVVLYFHRMGKVVEYYATQLSVENDSQEKLDANSDSTRNNNHVYTVLDDACYTIISYLHELQHTNAQLLPLVLFPQYQAMCLILKNVSLVPDSSDYHAVDLFYPDSWKRLLRDASIHAPTHIQLSKVRNLFESLLLKVLNGNAGIASGNDADDKALSDMAMLMGVIADQSDKLHQYSFWKACEAAIQSGAVLSANQENDFNRWLARISLQIQRVVSGSGDLSERLFRQALFFTALSPTSTNKAVQTPLQSQLLKTYDLSGVFSLAFEQARYGKALPVNDAELVDKVSRLSHAWSEAQPPDLRADGLKIRSDEWQHRLRTAQQCLSDVQRSLSVHGLNVLSELTQVMTDAVSRVLTTDQKLPISLGLEGAHAIVWIQQSISSLGTPWLVQQQQATALADRVKASAGGVSVVPKANITPPAIDQHLRAKVVDEAKVTLGQVEKQLDDMFRYGQSAAAGSVNLAPMAQTASALKLIDLPHLSTAIEALSARIGQPLRADLNDEAFKHIARLFSQITAALDVFAHAPINAQQHYLFDATRFELINHHEQSQLSSNTHAEQSGDGFTSIESLNSQRRADIQALAQQATDNPRDNQTHQALANSLQSVREDAELTGDFELTALSQLTDSSAVTVADANFNISSAANLAQVPVVSVPISSENELYTIFITEAQEVLTDSAQMLHALEEKPNNIELLKDIRRGFHTLKGSARMVGFKAFGDAAWHVEQTVNTALANADPASIDLIQFMRCGRDALSAWLLQLDDALLGMGDAPVLDTNAWMSQLPASCTVHSFTSQLAPYLQAIERSFERQQSATNHTADLTVKPELVALLNAKLIAPVGTSANSTTNDIDSKREDSRREVGKNEDNKLDDKAADAEPSSRPTIRLVANNEGMRPQDFINKARAAVAQAYAVQASQEAIAPAENNTNLNPVKLQAVHVSSAVGAAIQTPVDTMISIGPLRLPKQLYDIYLQEAGGHITALQQSIADQHCKIDEPVSYAAYKYAHSLRGSASTIGFSVLKDIAAPLEQVLQAAQESKQALDSMSLKVVNDAVEALADIFKQFSQGAYPAAQDKHSDALLRLPKVRSKPIELVVEPTRELAKSSESLVQPNMETASSVVAVTSALPVIEPLMTVHIDEDDTNISVDEIDDDIWFDFEEEAEQLLPRVQHDLNLLAKTSSALDSLRRDLHTLKGSSRMAGAMRMGAMVHNLESDLEDAVQIKFRGTESLTEGLDVETHARLLTAFDVIFQTYSKLKSPTPCAVASAAMTATSQKFATEMAQTSALFDNALSVPLHSQKPTEREKTQVTPSLAVAAVLPTATPLEVLQPVTAPVMTAPIAVIKPNDSPMGVTLPALRMRADILDQWVNQASEIAGSKGRLDQHVLHLRQSLRELTDNVERLRQQLREIEIQAESQMATRTELANATQAAFDPLEFDRFTRFQELTRMLSESLGDMHTVRDNVAKTLQDAEQDLINQTKANKALTQSLIRSRLLAFDAISDRLYRVVRQTSRELGKQVILDIQGGHFMLDRSVLERMTAGLEHLVRNSVVHGIESPAQRLKLGKAAQGMISLIVKQQGNELEIVLQDDGAGLPLARIRDIAIAKGLLNHQALPTVQQLTEFIFAPGFSTVETVSELAGRGVGMDVVRSDVVALGGRITLSSTADKGARFTVRIPLTLAINQVLMVIAQDIQYAIPSSLIQSVVTVKPADLAQAYDQGLITQGGSNYPFAHLSDLLNIPSHATLHTRNASVILLSNGNGTVAIHVDSIIGNQESIIKPLSPMMARIPGLSSASLMNNGQLCLILDPVQLHLSVRNTTSKLAVGDVANSNTAESVNSTDSAHKNSLKAKLSDSHAPVSAYALAPQSAKRNTALPMAHVVTPRDKTVVKLAMVVDDSLTVRKITQKLLLREGWEVLLAKDGIDALEQLQSVTPNIMLVDIEMPRMDGFDLTRNVRADDTLKAIPIIMITSRIADKHRDHALSLGVNAYMGKPYRDDELLAEMVKLTTV